MPYKRPESPFYMIRRKLPGGIQTPTLSTRVKSKRVALHMERLLERIAELAIIDPSYADVLEAVLSRQVDLPTLAAADRKGQIKDVRMLVANPLIRDVVADHLALETERGARFGYEQIIEGVPDSARLSWLQSPRNVEKALRTIQAARNQKPNSTLRYAGRAIRKLLKRELGSAERDRIWSEVNFQRVDDSRRVSLSAPEILRILDSCPSFKYRTYIMSIIFTGADRGVMLGVKRRDVEVWVQDGRYSGKMYLRDGKNESRPRTVGLGHHVSLAIARIAEDLHPDERVFGYSYAYVGKAWRSVRQKAGLPDLRIKDLRHVFAGLGLDAEGISLAALKGGMGHSKLATTMRYADRDISFDSTHASRIEEMVFGQTG